MKRLLACAGLLALIHAMPAFAASGAVGSWPLSEGSGTTATDASGNGDNGALSGGVSWTQLGGRTSLLFDGATGEVTVADRPALEPAQAVTVSAWIRHQGSPGIDRYVVAKGASGCIAASYGLYTGTDGTLHFYVAGQSGRTWTGSPSASSSIWDGRWHLAVGTFDGSAIRLFVDGAEVGSGTSYAGPLVYSLPDSNDLYIGNYPGCAAHGLAGQVDGVQIWNRALSSGEVQALFSPQTGTDPAPPPPSQTAIPPAASAAPSAAGGAPAPAGSGTPQSAVTPASSSGGQAPAITAIKLSVTGARMARRRRLTVRMIDARRETVTLRVFRLAHGALVASRCVAPRSRRPVRAARACETRVLIGSIVHANGRGPNTARFARAAGRGLSASRYELVIAPRTTRRAGATILVPFTVGRTGALAQAATRR